MLKTYDTTQAAYVEHTPKIYFTGVAAWGDAPSAKTYDTTEAAWVERLKEYMKLTVTDGFYDNTGNVIFNYGDTFACEVKPSSRSYEITAAIEGEFVNPVISYEYYFGNSDLCPNVAADFRSHACIEWTFRAYLNGTRVKNFPLVSGNNYAYTTIFNETGGGTAIEGTFDKIEFVCVVNSFSNYADYGKASTGLNNITIDGKLYEGNTVIDSN